MANPLFQHRHYVEMARIIAAIQNDQTRRQIADHFSWCLHSSNPEFDADRFMSAAIGEPCNWRDRV